MKKISQDFKLGLLIFIGISSAFVFGWFLGIPNPFQNKTELYITYGFAGGIDIGSPVRVSGIKVGRVEEIDFYVPVPRNLKDSLQVQDSSYFPVRLKISVLNKAMLGIRKDSKPYINLAGVIGDRYVEITPGSPNLPNLKNGDWLIGVDPPRIDQLISQSFNFFESLLEVVQDNKDDLKRSIEMLYKLSGSLEKAVSVLQQNKTFHSEIPNLIQNLIKITSDFSKLTQKIETPEGQKALDTMYKLLLRLEPLDAQVIQNFLQKEGVKVQIF